VRKFSLVDRVSWTARYLRYRIDWEATVLLGAIGSVAVGMLFILIAMNNRMG
jgi:hypothetical protein